MRIGVNRARVQLGVVFHQPVQDEDSFAQTAKDGLLMQAHRGFAGVGVQRDAASMQQTAKVGGRMSTGA